MLSSVDSSSVQHLKEVPTDCGNETSQSILLQDKISIIISESWISIEWF